MKSESSLTIFDYIREINKLPAEILSPAKFKILVEIAMRLGEHGKTWPKNKELSINTAIKLSSIKVLMSQLKKENFINIEKEDGQRMIYLCHPTERKRLMVINQNGKRLMVINQKVNGDLPPYIKEKEKKKIKEKSGPAADSIFKKHPYFDELYQKIPFKNEIKKTILNDWLWKNNGDRPYIFWLARTAQKKQRPARYFMGGLYEYYPAYLRSDEYKVAGAILDFKDMRSSEEIIYPH